MGDFYPWVFAIMDGARLSCADYEDIDVRNAFYEGYTCLVEVTCVLVFIFDGCLIHAALSFPGSWHGSRMAHESGFVPAGLNDENTLVGRAVLCGSAFALDARVRKGKDSLGVEGVGR